MLIKHETILEEVARIKGIPYEKARVIFNDFFQQLLMHLQHPEDNFIHGIIIENSIKIELNPKKVMRAYMKIRNPESYNTYVVNLIKTHQQLLKHDTYTEEQKKIIADYERNRIHPAGDTGYCANDQEG